MAFRPLEILLPNSKVAPSADDLLETFTRSPISSNALNVPGRCASYERSILNFLGRPIGRKCFAVARSILCEGY